MRNEFSFTKMKFTRDEKEMWDFLFSFFILSIYFSFLFVFSFDIIYQLNFDPWGIGLTSGVFANGPEDLGSIPGRVIPKTQKMVLDFTLLNTQHCKVWIKGKVEQSKEWSSTLPYTLV